MFRTLPILIAILAIGCVSRAPKENVASDQVDPADETSIGIVAGGVSITSHAESGERRWQVEAAKADAELRTGEFVGGLENVKLTLFQGNVPYATVMANKGQANEAEQSYRLEGDVKAKSADGRTSLSANAVSNTTREGELHAVGGVSGITNGMRIDRANSAKALFTQVGRPGESATLKTISIQGDDVWFRSSDNDLVISGVLDGEMEFVNDNRDIRFKLRGSPVKMVWRQHGLTVSGTSLDATATRVGERYLLKSGAFSGSVNVQITGSEGGASWTANVSAPTAVFNGQVAELRLSGGVRANSKHPSLSGTLTAPSATVRFDKSALESRSAFDPIAITASGGNVRFEDERTDVLVTNLDSITLTRGAQQNRTRFDATGAPFQLRQPRVDGVEKIAISARAMQGEVGPGLDNGKNATVLLWLKCQRGIIANMSGPLPPEQRTASVTSWSVEGKCESLDYNRSNSKMTLLGVSELQGRHPAMISGSGTIYSPQIDITFRPNTYQPQKIAFSKSASQ